MRETLDRETGRTRLVGYAAALTITITTSDFDALPELMEIAAASGATRLDSAQRVSDRPALKKRARELAATAAKEKAEAMAELLGIALGPIRGIEERDGGTHANYELNNVQRRVSARPTSDAHGDNEEVTATVTLTYDLG